jgi:rod shape-determining protein MreC
MNWIRAHKFLTLILCTFVVLCALILASFLSQGSTSPIGMQIARATAFVQRPLALAAFEVRDGVIGFRQVIAENEELREENARLREELHGVRLRENDLQELRELARLLDHEIMDYDRNIVVANIISLDGSNWFNVFTIDKGTNDGVFPDSVVISGQGLVGIVMEAGSNWARVSAVIDTVNPVGFAVARDPYVIGIVHGDGNGALEGFMIDNLAEIVVGDTLLTAGLGDNPMYPRGIEIGRIVSVYYDRHTLTRTITVEPAVNFSHLRRVAIIL